MILNNIFTILSQNSLPTYIYLIPALISSFLIFRLFRHGIHLLKDSEKENAIEQHRLLTVQQEIDHLHSLDQEYQKLYVWNHDMANHLLALSLLSEQEKYDQALSYMKQLQEMEVNINEINKLHHKFAIIFDHDLYLLSFPNIAVIYHLFIY